MSTAVGCQILIGVRYGEPLAMLWAYQKLRMVRTALCTRDTPRQMAAGLACGLLLGLLPKGNLVAVAVAGLLLATRMSLSTGMLCALIVGLFAPVLDPITHRLGEWVLTTAAMVPLWRSLARLPLAAWTSFNNTVVMGSLVLGSLLAYPAYRISLPWMHRLQQRFAATPESSAANTEKADEEHQQPSKSIELADATLQTAPPSLTLPSLTLPHVTPPWTVAQGGFRAGEVAALGPEARPEACPEARREACDGECDGECDGTCGETCVCRGPASEPGIPQPADDVSTDETIVPRRADSGQRRSCA